MTNIVNKDVDGVVVICDHLCRIVVCLSFVDSALQVAFESLLAPWAFGGVADGGEGGSGSILLYLGP